MNRLRPWSRHCTTADMVGGVLLILAMMLMAVFGATHLAIVYHLPESLPYLLIP